jgi:hypothetical protein
MSNSKATRLVQWLIFSVAVAIAPLIFSYISQLTRGLDPSIGVILRNGELLLISTAIAAEAIGELLSSKTASPTNKMISGGCSILVLFFGSLWFADITSAIASGVIVRQDVIVAGSLVIFIFTLISSLSCKLQA